MTSICIDVSEWRKERKRERGGRKREKRGREERERYPCAPRNHCFDIFSWKVPSVCVLCALCALCVLCVWICGYFGVTTMYVTVTSDLFCPSLIQELPWLFREFEREGKCVCMEKGKKEERGRNERERERSP